MWNFLASPYSGGATNGTIVLCLVALFGIGTLFGLLLSGKKRW